MKKWIIALLVLVASAIAGIYIFIPSQLKISSVDMLTSSSDGTFRTLSNKNKQDRWLPSSTANGHFTIDKLLWNTVYITITKDNEKINSVLMLVPINSDSTGVQWKCEIATSNNPFGRLQRYWYAVALKNDMDKILDSLRAFVSRPENIYGMPLERTSFTDSLLVATRKTFITYPGTTEIYELVNALRLHIAKKNALETGHPLLNVTPLDSNHYQLMVALPVDRILPDEQSFFFRRMIPAAFMKAEIKGGPCTVKEALRQMQLYFSDHNKTAMAIPFEYLITDRVAEPDTTKWITHIYAPVF